jgi:hypothetical protein
VAAKDDRWQALAASLLLLARVFFPSTSPLDPLYPSVYPEYVLLLEPPPVSKGTSILSKNRRASSRYTPQLMRASEGHQCKKVCLVAVEMQRRAAWECAFSLHLDCCTVLVRVRN